MNWLVIGFVLWAVVAWAAVKVTKVGKQSDAQLESDRERIAYEASQNGEHAV